MERYDIVNKLEDIMNTSGIWVEQEYDETTHIWESDCARYMVPFSNDTVIDINTGNRICYEIIKDVENINTSNKYRWMLINKFDKKIF